MTRHGLHLAIAALAAALAAPAPALAIIPAPGLASAIAPAAGGVSPIVWQCATKQVCLKWGNHHNCERWGQE